MFGLVLKKLINYSIKNKRDLIDKVIEIWQNIPNEFIRNLINSMPKRVESVLRAMAGHTKY